MVRKAYFWLTTKIIIITMKLLPSGILSEVNEYSLEELDKRNWIVWADSLESQNDN